MRVFSRYCLFEGLINPTGVIKVSSAAAVRLDAQNKYIIILVHIPINDIFLSMVSYVCCAFFI